VRGLKPVVSEFVGRCEWELQSRTFGICRTIGIEWLAMEGYWTPDAGGSLTVVDCDLPLDYVFMYRQNVDDGRSVTAKG